MSELTIEAKSTPKISVIVPVYNVEKYIHQCIDSILGQTFIDFELLLIDDGSPDNCGAICDDYAVKDPRVRVFHQENAGVSAARNKGLDEARGEWISFVDSDDWLDEAHLNNYMRKIDCCNSADLIFQGYKLVANNIYRDNNIKISKSTNALLKSVLILELRDLFGWTWIKIFKRDFIVMHSLRFDESLSIGEDYLFTLNYCQYIKSVEVVYSSTYYYRVRSNSLMHTGEINKFILEKEVKIHNARKKLVQRDLYYKKRYMLIMNTMYILTLLSLMRCIDTDMNISKKNMYYTLLKLRNILVLKYILNMLSCISSYALIFIRVLARFI